MLTQERLKELLHYCPALGMFWWNDRKSSPSFSAKHSGHLAGHLNERGYVRVQIAGKNYKTHRLAFLYMTGQWPKDQVDHRNGWKLDNAWDNLREATNAQNSANRPPKRKGVPKGAKRKRHRWEARISYDGRTEYLGLLDTPEEANEAYAKRAREVHGEFARAA